MAGIRPPDNATPAAPSESTEENECTLFVLCSQYVLTEKLGAGVGCCEKRPLRAGLFSFRSSFYFDVRAVRTAPVGGYGGVVVLDARQPFHRTKLADGARAFDFRIDIRHRA